MKSKCALAIVLAGLIAVTFGCATEPAGSREFIPGQGWVPTK